MLSTVYVADAPVTKGITLAFWMTVPLVFVLLLTEPENTPDQVPFTVALGTASPLSSTTLTDTCAVKVLVLITVKPTDAVWIVSCGGAVTVICAVFVSDKSNSFVTVNEAVKAPTVV